PEQVCSAGITFRTKHALQARRRNPGFTGKLCEADGRIDVVAQNAAPGCEVAIVDELKSFKKKALTEGRLTPRALADGLAEISGKSHFNSPVCASVSSPLMVSSP